MEKGMQTTRITHALSHIVQSKLPGLSLTMTDRALSPIDWRRAERRDGRKERRMTGSPVLQLTSHTSLAGLEVERVFMGMEGMRIEGSSPFAQMHTHTCTHTRLILNKSMLMG